MNIVVAFLFLIASFAAHGQLLKCVAKDGKVEYAAQCPPGTKELQTGIKSAPGGGPAPAAKSQQKSLAEMDADFKKRRTEQTEAQAKQEKEVGEKEQRQRACEEARNYLTGLEAGARVTRTDPKTGERVFLEDAGRAQEIGRARQSVQANCK